MAPDSRNVIVIGGGIIGLSTSYYTLTSPHLPPNSTVTLIERASIAHGASSRAAGIIASAWHSSEVIPLAEISWDCYEELNEKYDGGREWDWRTTRISGVDVGHKTVARSAYRRLPREKGRVDGESWLNGDKYDMTGEGGTATMYVYF
jgi:glycine/D-amino acid oxidase-like deaminating enzyme